MLSPEIVAHKRDVPLSCNCCLMIPSGKVQGDKSNFTGVDRLVQVSMRKLGTCLVISGWTKSLSSEVILVENSLRSAMRALCERRRTDSHFGSYLPGSEALMAHTFIVT